MVVGCDSDVLIWGLCRKRTHLADKNCLVLSTFPPDLIMEVPMTLHNKPNPYPFSDNGDRCCLEGWHSRVAFSEFALMGQRLWRVGIIIYLNQGNSLESFLCPYVMFKSWEQSYMSGFVWEVLEQLAKTVTIISYIYIYFINHHLFQLETPKKSTSSDSHHKMGGGFLKIFFQWIL